MKKSFRSVFLAIGSVTVSLANAQVTCASYVEQTIQPMNASDLWSQLAKIPNVKDEYETTGAFDARVDKMLGTLSGAIFVEIPIEKKYVTYNADDSRLDVMAYAFSNHNTKYDGVFGYGTKFYGKVAYENENINLVFPSEEKRLGSYVGTTALGAKVRIAKIKRTTKAIFEGPAKWGQGLFGNILGNSSNYKFPLLSFNNVTPEMAKVAKDTARGAIVYIPKAPYFARGKFPWDEPTLTDPIEVDETVEVAIGDIQCALFLNASGKVFGAVTTK